jgi:teichuronic acid biosynthesis glycosyltransferase TuaC
MKILTFTSLFPNQNRPDFGIFIFQRISHISSRPGNIVQVVSPAPYFPSWIPSKRWEAYGQLPRQERIGNLDVYHPRYPLLPGLFMPLHGLLMFLGSVLLVRKLHRQFHFDCIDAHYIYPDGLAAVLLGKVLGLPVVLSARGTDINVFPSFWTIRPMIVWSLRSAAGIIAVAAALKSAIVNLGLPSEKVCVIPNGVDLERFHPIDKSEARRTLALPVKGKIAISVGSLTEVKNHKLLISAFAKVAEGLPDLRLYIVGDGPLRLALENLIRGLRLQEKVSLVGPRPNQELALWFSAADVSCLVSFREGWPNVLMESIACGTPVVATRVGGVPEILCSPGLGAIAEQNPESVAATLQAAMAREWNRKALALHAQARAWDIVAEEVVLYFASLVSTADPRLRNPDERNLS